MPGVVVIGSGGHATVVVDLMLAAGMPVAALLDDDPTRTGSSVLGVPVTGGLAVLADLPHDGVVVAIGDNRVRAELFAKLAAQGERLVTVTHPTAVLSPSAKIGAGSMICAGAFVGPETIVGDNVILNTGCSVDHHNVIGAHAHLGPGVRTGGTVTVGEGTLVGISSAMLPGRSVGAWSTIGGGAVVINDIPDHTTAIGVPAKPRP